MNNIDQNKRMKKNKKPFESPLVVQSVAVLLEEGLLQGPSSLGSLQATGHEVEEHDAFVNSAWD